MLENDGDIIRRLGFVTLYSAYLEEMIDDFLSLLKENGHCDNYDHRWPISHKIHKAVSALRDGRLGDQATLVSILESASALFENRNEVVHGRIYADIGDKCILCPGRPDREKRPIDPSELYDLANKLLALRCEMYSSVIHIESLQTLFSVF